jgi:RNA recognition motif-containing protein
VTKLYVGNLPFSATDVLLRHIFEDVGAVRYAKIVTDFDGRSRGFGFVEMSAPEDAAAAIARFNGDIYDGRVVTVSLAQPKMRELTPVKIHEPELTGP